MTDKPLGVDRPSWIMVASIPFWALMNLGMASGEAWTTVVGAVPVAAFCVWALHGAWKGLHNHVLPAMRKDIEAVIGR